MSELAEIETERLLNWNKLSDIQNHLRNIEKGLATLQNLEYKGKVRSLEN